MILRGSLLNAQLSNTLGSVNSGVEELPAAIMVSLAQVKATLVQVFQENAIFCSMK